ncbi:hypothetical protein R6Q59_023140 [Mikania micrantha]|uniref:J domain-containing protein n=1 Tax=Mikania micrantha TaxID=192012 RepID=A0A5N6MZ67_9ASTR|nr:hypothetical protein E3N88_28340 [Mikania micrantha]
MDSFINHYQVLGLSSGEEAFKISKKEITKAYRLKALEMHPDKNPDDPNAVFGFQTLQASYEILKDEKSRMVFNKSLMTRIRQRKLQRCEENETEMMSDDEVIRRWRMRYDREERIITKMVDKFEKINRMSVMKRKTGERMACSFDKMMKHFSM